eukprot:6636631-Ditylum_brightwellii.AAC.1
MHVEEYRGTNYAGFQRQQTTDTIISSSSAAAAAAEEGTTQQRSRKRMKRSGQVPTIQDKLEEALVLLTKKDVRSLRVRGAGRTDKGVHATGQVVAFDLEYDENNAATAATTNNDNNNSNNNNNTVFAEPINHPDTNWKIQRAINTRLPNDIFVSSVSLLSSSHNNNNNNNDNNRFEPRENVKLKRYTYRIRYRNKITNAKAPPICNSGINTIRHVMYDTPDIWICPWSLDEHLMKKACDALT